jgi:hypothetical protein
MAFFEAKCAPKHGFCLRSNKNCDWCVTVAKYYKCGPRWAIDVWRREMSAWKVASLGWYIITAGTVMDGRSVGRFIFALLVATILNFVSWLYEKDE